MSKVIEMTNKQTKNIAEDKELLKGIARKENKALHEFMKKYQPVIFYKMMVSVKNEEDARDLTMEIFTKVYEKAASYKEASGAVSTWLFGIANNHLIDFYRKESIISVHIDDAGIDISDDSKFIQVMDEEDIANESMEKEEVYKLLMNVIETKIQNEGIKAILKMRYVDELSYEEISLKVGLPLGSVKSCLFRGRDTLKTLLKNKSNFFI